MKKGLFLIAVWLPWQTQANNGVSKRSLYHIHRTSTTLHKPPASAEYQKGEGEKRRNQRQGILVIIIS